ncbi:hypothetical protein Pd630_LPD17010 (plasmid) [Rhodococcus opacus PD630]|nr:hypothetical protein Pd630_LPD17010 [Rhodococcus opacus PD630]
MAQINSTEAVSRPAAVDDATPTGTADDAMTLEVRRSRRSFGCGNVSHWPKLSPQRSYAEITTPAREGS